MRSGALPYIVLAILVLFALDFYAWKGIRMLLKRVRSNAWHKITFIVFWGNSVILLLLLLSTLLIGMHGYSPGRDQFFLFLIGYFILSLIPKLVFIIFHFSDDLFHLARVVFRKIFPGKKIPIEGENISRSTFITRLGLYMAAVPFASIAYGILKGKYDYHVLSEKLLFSSLPRSFHGLRIVQLSDLHIGSFMKDHEPIKKVVQLVNALKPDVIFFTGDLVNNYADETDGWEPVLSSLQAKHGKYAIFGNHDYSDYVQWTTKQDKENNLLTLKSFIQTCGFRLLMNEHDVITVDNESITIVGVENWGKATWSHRYGNLAKAMKGTDPSAFKILLSHDPSHWDAEVLGKTTIPLTLSGHTHGMQMGVEIGSIKWSPVKYFYPRWAGLYKEGEQHLYVNRGLGFIGFPGRVGMPPEITLIELACTTA